MTPRRVPISAKGVKQLWSDSKFLEKLAAACPLADLDEPFDESDAWWWLCSKWEAMKRYRRRDLKATALNWVARVTLKEVLEARKAAEAGDYDHLLPDEVRDAAR